MPKWVVKMFDHACGAIFQINCVPNDLHSSIPTITNKQKKKKDNSICEFLFYQNVCVTLFFFASEVVSIRDTGRIWPHLDWRQRFADGIHFIQHAVNATQINSDVKENPHRHQFRKHSSAHHEFSFKSILLMFILHKHINNREIKEEQKKLKHAKWN